VNRWLPLLAAGLAGALVTRVLLPDVLAQQAPSIEPAALPCPPCPCTSEQAQQAIQAAKAALDAAAEKE
jgi:hypothetical protein